MQVPPAEANLTTSPSNRRSWAGAKQKPLKEGLAPNVSTCQLLVGTFFLSLCTFVATTIFGCLWYQKKGQIFLHLVELTLKLMAHLILPKKYLNFVLFMCLSLGMPQLNPKI
jgi:hypothetical protein